MRTIDPPDGWKYGFPKPIPDDVKNVKKWLVENGYPQKEIDVFKNGVFPCWIKIIPDNKENKKQNNMKEEIQNYVFHFNIYTQKWNGIPRDLYNKYWDNHKIKGVLQSSDIKTLIELIGKGDKFINSVKKEK